MCHDLRLQPLLPDRHILIRQIVPFSHHAIDTIRHARPEVAKLESVSRLLALVEISFVWMLDWKSLLLRSVQTTSTAQQKGILGETDWDWRMVKAKDLGSWLARCSAYAMELTTMVSNFLVPSFLWCMGAFDDGFSVVLGSTASQTLMHGWIWYLGWMLDCFSNFKCQMSKHEKTRHGRCVYIM